MSTIAKAAQSLPYSGGLARVSQLGVLALMLGTVALPVSGVWAQQALSGAQTATQSPTVATGSPLVVTTASGFSVITTSPTVATGVGVNLYSKGGISFTDTNQATITGYYRGIWARNEDAAGLGGAGGTALTITTTGLVTGKDIPSGGNYYYGLDGTAIFAENQYGGDLTISVASVTGDNGGIDAQGVSNSGALTITATGVVNGTNRAGIDAYNQGTNLIIAAYKVLGGITAESKGSGALSITTTGDVTDGIFAKNQGGTSLTINAAKVSGQVIAYQYGTGALSITASGDVTDQFADAIHAYNKGTDLTISAASVSGYAFGIFAKNAGSGALSITATAVSGGSLYNGIEATNAGTDLTISTTSVSGGNNGIYAANSGTGALAITATGAVSGNSNKGIYAKNTSTGTDLTISAASVSGASTGIYAKNDGSGVLAITATDAVIGTFGQGIYASGKGSDLTISATSVSGGINGVYAAKSGSGEVEITATGAVTGTSGDGIHAVSAYSGDLTISAAAVSGGINGIFAYAFYALYGTGALTITATGAVTGTSGDGIHAASAYSGDLTISAAAVSGGINGISAYDLYGTGALTITATGDVTGTSGKGIYAKAYGYTGTDLMISAASVSGATTGIYAKNYGSGVLAITATDAVIGTSGQGIYAYGKGSDLTISATSVSGGDNGIKAINKGTGALSITTTGSVTAGGDYSDGIRATNYGTDLTISVNSVSGGKYEKAVYARNNGSGKLSITVSGAVVAGADSHAFGIETNAADGGEVAIHLLSTSSVSGPEAIKDLGGDAVVTIDAGAVVTGAISLEYGNDTLTIASGVNLSGVTFMSGGSDDAYNSKDFTDTLNISSGWSNSLTDWEVINADTSGGDFALSGFSLGNRSFSKLGAGTLTLNGALTLASGSTLKMDVLQDWADPIILATDTAVIAGHLVVTPRLGLTFGHAYTLVSADSVTGTFSDVSIAGAFEYVATYNPTSVQLQLSAGSLVDFGGSGLGPNARAVAGALDAAVERGYVPAGFESLYLSNDALNAKLGELSGELHSAEQRVALDDTRVVQDAALDRLGYGLTGRSDGTVGGAGSFWAQGLGSWGSADADATGAASTTQQQGVLMGVDFAQGDITYGGLFSYTTTGVDLGSLGQSDVTSTGAAAYAGYRQAGSGLAFGIGGALASTSAKGERSISIAGLEQRLTSTLQGTSYQIFGEVSNDLAKAGTVQIEPFARLAYAKVQSDAFAETGGLAALNGAAQSHDLRTATFGLRGAYVAGTTTLRGSAAWQHSAGDLSAPTTLSMAGVDVPYTVNSAALDQNALELDAQASIHLSSGAVLTGGYTGRIGQTTSTHGLRVTLSMAW